jgi:hypothetical protein
LEEFANRSFFLSSIVPGGKQTQREVLAHVAKQKKIDLSELTKLPKLPASIGYIWGWFCEVNTNEKLKYSELLSWSQVTQKELSIFEVETITNLNHLYLTHLCRMQT